MPDRDQPTRRTADAAISELFVRFEEAERRNDERHQANQKVANETKEQVQKIGDKVTGLDRAVDRLVTVVQGFTELVETINKHIDGGVAKNRESINDLDKRVDAIERWRVQVDGTEGLPTRLKDVEDWKKASLARRGLAALLAQGAWRDVIGPIVKWIVIGVMGIVFATRFLPGNTAPITFTSAPTINAVPTKEPATIQK